MKKAFPLLLLAACFSNILSAQNALWQWAQCSPGFAQPIATCVTTDNAGNAYVSGFYFGNQTIIIGVDTLPALTSGSDFYGSLFLARFDAQGDMIWLQTAGMPEQTSGIEVSRIARDNQGSIYIGGRYKGDSIMLGATMLPGSYIVGGWNVFLAKYDEQGNFKWAAAGLSNNFPECQGLTTDASGNIYICGSFDYDSVLFGSTLLTNSTNNQQQGFLAKYDQFGSLIYAIRAQQCAASEIDGIGTDANGNLFATGYFSGDSLALNGLSTQTQNSNPQSGAENFFIAELSSNGNPVGIKTETGNYNTLGNNIAIDQFNNVYITGLYDDTTYSFGADTFSPPLTSGAFVRKYNESFNLQWSKYTSLEAGSLLATNNELYLAGNTTGDSLIFANTVLHSNLAPNYGISALLNLDQEGNILCWDFIGNGVYYPEGVAALCPDQNGNQYIAGIMDAGNFVSGGDTLTSNECSGTFLAKFRCGPVAGLQTIADKPTLQIYPNPFSANATVQYALPTASKNANLIISDILGRQINTYKLTEAEGSININAVKMNAGIYFCSLVEGGKVFVTKKMVVE